MSQPKQASENRNTTPEDRSAPTGVARIGTVTLDSTFAEGPPNPAENEGFIELQQRIEQSKELAEDLAKNNPFLNEQHIEAVLQKGLENSKLDALMIATRDGLTVAEATVDAVGDIQLIGALVEDTAIRAEREGIVARMDEMLLRGAHGEMVAVRYFPQTEHRFFLLAYARRRCTYRRETNRILKVCGPMLAEFL